MILGFFQGSVSLILGGNWSIPRKPLTCRRAGLEYIYVRLRSTSMSDFYITDICTSDLCPFFNFSNRHPILKSMSFFLLFQSRISCFHGYLTVNNRRPFQILRSMADLLIRLIAGGRIRVRAYTVTSLTFL
jgi:hypothetical protein